MRRPLMASHPATGESFELNAIAAAVLSVPLAWWLGALAMPGLYLVGGSIPERDAAGKVYNACVAFGPDGAIRFADTAQNR